HASPARRDAVVRRAAKCLFPKSITSAPALKSVKDGVATLTASSQLPLFPPKVPHFSRAHPHSMPPIPDSEWQAVIHPHGIGFTFDPYAICSTAARRGTNAARRGTNWAGSVFTVTVVTDAAPRQMSPPPHSFQPHSSQAPSYSWTSPHILCGTFPRVYVNVPTNLAEHWAAMAYIWYLQARVL